MCVLGKIWFFFSGFILEIPSTGRREIGQIGGPPPAGYRATKKKRDKARSRHIEKRKRKGRDQCRGDISPKEAPLLLLVAFTIRGGDTTQSLRPILKNSWQKFRTQHNKSVRAITQSRNTSPWFTPNRFQFTSCTTLMCTFSGWPPSDISPTILVSSRHTQRRYYLIIALGHTHTHTYTQRHGCQVGIFSAKSEKMALFDNSWHFIC